MVGADLEGGDRKLGRKRRRKRKAGGSHRGGSTSPHGIRRHQVVGSLEYCTQYCNAMLVSSDFTPRTWGPIAKFWAELAGRLARLFNIEVTSKGSESR